MTKLIMNLAILIGGSAIIIGVLVALSIIFVAAWIIVLARKINPSSTDGPQPRLIS